MNAPLTLQRETFAEVINDARPLLCEHWLEIAHYQDIPLAVNEDNYRRIDAAGLLRIYTARRGGILVGYACFLVDMNSHYMTSKQAKQDVVYVEQSSRGAFVGIRLLKFADAALKAEGVQVVYHHVKLSHPALGALLKHQGYEPIETIYGRRLDIEKPPRKGRAASDDSGRVASLAAEPATSREVI